MLFISNFEGNVRYEMVGKIMTINALLIELQHLRSGYFINDGNEKKYLRGKIDKYWL